MTTTFESLCHWYTENRIDLLKRYEGQIVLIYKSAVQGTYSSYIDAYVAGEAEIGAGNFLIETVTDPRTATSYIL